MPKFSELKVGLALPYVGYVEGTWSPDETQRKAAWEMYVELVTRIAVTGLSDDEGILRDALHSLHSLFARTRTILHTYGPDIARPKKDSEITFGYLSIAILNTVLRPLLAKWHPLLRDYEEQRPVHVSSIDHERNWVYYDALRVEIEQTRQILVKYAYILAEVAGVPALVIDR